MAANISAIFPSWDQLNFSRNCAAYGQWLSAFIAPNPWNPADALGGSIPLSLELFDTALPPGWTYMPPSSSASGNGNSTGMDVTTVIASPEGTEYFGQVMQWYTTKLYATHDAATGSWYADTAFVNNVIWAPADDCPAEFCKAIAFTGNADLSGIGVVISYYIEASLVTLYLLIFTIWRIRRFFKGNCRAAAVPNSSAADTTTATRGLRDRIGTPPAMPASGRTQATRPPAPRPLTFYGRRLFDALRGSLYSSITCAIVLALSILIAAVIMSAKRVNEHSRRPVDEQNIPSGNALYDSALSLLVGLFSVFPVMVLYALIPAEGDVTLRHHVQMGRRQWLRRGLLVVLWALAAAMVFLDPRSELDYDYQGVVPATDVDENNFADVLYACDQRGGLNYWHALRALQYLIIGVPLLWLFLTGLVSYLTRRRQRRQSLNTEEGKLRKPTTARAVVSSFLKILLISEAVPGERVHPQPIRMFWRQAVAWINCGLMWTILIALTELRHNIAEVAGGLDNQDEWAFSQIIAILTWSPVAADFTFLLLFGVEAGLAGHLPLDYSIHPIESNKTDDHYTFNCQEQHPNPETSTGGGSSISAATALLQDTAGTSNNSTAGTATAASMDAPDKQNFSSNRSSPTKRLSGHRYRSEYPPPPTPPPSQPLPRVPVAFCDCENGLSRLSDDASHSISKSIDGTRESRANSVQSQQSLHVSSPPATE